MKKMKRILLFVFLCFAMNGFAQIRKYSNEFLSIGVGARALGMSGAYVVSVDDVMAGYWNPAGLRGIKNKPQIALMHADYFAGIAKYDYAAYAKSMDSSGSMAISFVRFAVDNIPNTTELIDANGQVDYNRISSFSAADYAFLFSYARSLNVTGLKVGGSAKIIRRKVGNFAGAWGFGLDAAAQYEYKKWKFAAVAKDVTTTFNAWSYNLSDEMKDVFASTGNEIPESSTEITLPKLILGGARKFDFLNEKVSVLSELDLDMTFDGKRNVLIKSKPVSLDPHWGVEVGYLSTVFIRAGIGNIQTTTDISGKQITMFQPNMGVGVKIKSVTIDYAFTDIGDQSVALYSNVFSLKFDINKKTK